MRFGARALAAALSALVLALVGSTHVAATAAPQAKDPDGSYDGGEVPPEDNAYDSVAISFDVSGNGRKIKRWTVIMNVVCVTYPVSVELIAQPMPTMKVDRSGRFHKVFTHSDDGTDARVEVSGKLVGRAVKDGTLSYDVGVCSRGDEPGDPIRWTAKRTGR